MKRVLSRLLLAACVGAPWVHAAENQADDDSLVGEDSAVVARKSASARQESLELPGLTACHQCEWRPKPNRMAAAEQCGMAPDGAAKLGMFECGFSPDCDRVCQFVECLE